MAEPIQYILVKQAFLRPEDKPVEMVPPETIKYIQDVAELSDDYYLQSNHSVYQSDVGFLEVLSCYYHSPQERDEVYNLATEALSAVGIAHPRITKAEKRAAFEIAASKRADSQVRRFGRRVLGTVGLPVPTYLQPSQKKFENEMKRIDSGRYTPADIIIHVKGGERTAFVSEEAVNRQTRVISTRKSGSHRSK